VREQQSRLDGDDLERAALVASVPAVTLAVLDRMAENL
jgi:hypothetical protein